MNALILVDIQNDFLPGGALAVPEGDQIIPIVNSLQPQFDSIVATQDWHPAHHASFAVNHPGKQPGDLIELHGLPQILWPAHCVQGSRGAEFAPGLDRSRWRRVFAKGADPKIDSYSGFFDNGRLHATGLRDYLKAEGVHAVTIAGLATDYCVKFTALDAAELGLSTFLVKDACRGVNLRPGDVEHALREMEEAGVQIITSQELLHGVRA